MYQAKNSGKNRYSIVRYGEKQKIVKRYCKKNRKMKQKAFHWKNPMESLILWNEKQNNLPLYKHTFEIYNCIIKRAIIQLWFNIMKRKYICIDLKSFYASVECVERGLDPMTTRLVVADIGRTEKTICLAITPAMKALGIKNRCRIFERCNRM